MIKDRFALDYFRYFTNPAVNHLNFLWFLLYGRWAQIFKFVLVDWGRHLNNCVGADLEYWEDMNFWDSLNMDYSKLVGLEIENK